MKQSSIERTIRKDIRTSVRQLQSKSKTKGNVTKGMHIKIIPEYAMDAFKNIL